MVARKQASSPRDGTAVKREVPRGGATRASGAYNGVVREQISDLQRARIIGAAFEVSSERGAANMTVAHIVERSGVSRRTFYEIFNDREDCFLAAFEQALEYATERVLPAYESGHGWREKIRAGLVALLSFFDEEPAIARVLVVESAAGSSAVLKRRSEAIGKLVAAVEEGACEARGTLPSLIGEGVVGGVLSVLHARLTQTKHEPLIEFTNSLMSMIVLPYLGAAAARKEIERSMPKSVSGQVKAMPFGTDPFKEAGLRLTYRTVRVLAVIADHPGASNRQVGNSAEMTDQGQVSKLLTRLKRAGMITNTELTPGKGAPNSWTLTPSGQRVVDTIQAHTEGHHPVSQER